MLHYRDLKEYLSLGMKLTKIHRVLKFKQSDWMKKYIDFNTEKRTNAANSLKISFGAYKLMMNSITRNLNIVTISTKQRPKNMFLSIKTIYSADTCRKPFSK